MYGEGEVFTRFWWGNLRDKLRSALGNEGYLYLTADNIRVINSRRWAGHMARMGQMRGAYWVSAGRPERKRPL
jgi:hypothetical protein